MYLRTYKIPHTLRTVRLGLVFENEVELVRLESSVWSHVPQAHMYVCFPNVQLFSDKKYRVFTFVKFPGLL